MAVWTAGVLAASALTVTSAPVAYPVGPPRADATPAPTLERRTTRPVRDGFSPYLYGGLVVSLGAVGGLLVATVRSKSASGRRLHVTGV
ncbi:hypothetical protein ACFVW2_14195 [Streptomyces sp. NPDC058171]